MKVDSGVNLYARPDQSLMILIRDQSSNQINTPDSVKNFPNQQTKDAIVSNERRQAADAQLVDGNHARIERMKAMQHNQDYSPHRKALDERKGHHVDIRV